MNLSANEMKRPATIKDVLDVAKGHLPTGGVFHSECSNGLQGRIVYMLFSERFQCTGCLSRWEMQTVKKSTQEPFGLNFWVPPMIVDDENLP